MTNNTSTCNDACFAVPEPIMRVCVRRYSAVDVHVRFYVMCFSGLLSSAESWRSSPHICLVD